MLSKIFYIVKPLIPRKWQLFLRRQLIRMKISGYKNIWPVLKGSEKQPDYFSGWPDNAKFALVLTHDVEHQKGYNRILQLMELEKEMGFVSTFYLVPERDYRVEKELLGNIRENGFDYGVHGLHHDGKLYSSEEEFLRRAVKINSYLKEWNTSGFRSPAMHHNLDWIGALNIDYDLSTFDTDPFEPQPDGVGTIFPFWVSNKRNINKGYIEIPYTLPQDFTPFILMKEKTIKIWKDKSDWIIRNNGMILVNVHPDYINFEDKSLIEEFPVSTYKSFLTYLKENYSGQYWNPLAADLARYVKSLLPPDQTMK